MIAMRLPIGHPGSAGRPASPVSAPVIIVGRRLALSLALVLAATLGRAVPCRAEGLVMEAPTLTGLTPGSSGSFDVLLVNTNPAGGAAFDVASDSFGLSLVGPLSISFTGVSIST